MSATVPECQKIKRVGWISMALNTFTCNRLTLLRLKGLELMAVYRVCAFLGHMVYLCVFSWTIDSQTVNTLTVKTDIYSLQLKVRLHQLP